MSMALSIKEFVTARESYLILSTTMLNKAFKTSLACKSKKASN